jgi:hypothetical protein
MAKPSRLRTRPPAPAPGPATLTDAATATFATGTAFASEWLAIAGTQAAAMTETFVAVLRGDKAFEDGVKSALDVYGEGLRQFALLPRTYGLRFYRELEQSRAGSAVAAEPPSPSPGRPRRRPRPRRKR